MNATAEKQITTIIQFGVGHVVCGKFERHDHPFLGPSLRSVYAATIRRWNTETGLGQLADGPGKATLDPIPFGISIPLTSINAFTELSVAGVEAWEKELLKTCPARVLESF